MTTMLEKMAAAIVEEEARQLQANFPRNEVSGMAVARAALLAIREPDEATIRAGVVGIDEVEGDCATEDGTAAGFTAMIDAILNEKPETTT